MQQKPYDFIVFIGRFQPFHNSHKKIISYAHKYTNTMLILVGSAQNSLTLKNPFSYQERKMLIEKSCEDISMNLTFDAVRDYPYNDNKWLQEVREKIDRMKLTFKTPPRVAIIGHKKDKSSYYLNLFPDMELLEVPMFEDVNATDIRNLFYTGKMELINNVPQPVFNFLSSYKETLTKKYENFVQEFNYIQSYKKSWEKAPYPVVFVTVDVVFICSGHILMIERKANPGKGMYALPGGFIDHNETIKESAIRELKEETKIDIKKEMLFSLIKEVKVFDKVDRSSRGRTITHAHFIEYNSSTFPKVKAASDAGAVHWIPLNQLSYIEGSIFEDHLHIIDHFVDVIN